MEEVKSHLRLYWEAGYSPIPIRPKSKAPLISEWSRFCEERPTETDIINWEFAYPNCGVGLALGEYGIALDIDLFLENAEEYKIYRKFHDLIPFSPAEKKGAKGFTRIYQNPTPSQRKLSWPFPELNSVDKKLRGFELLALGNHTVVPPSIHENGKPYTGSEIWKIKYEHLPFFPANFIEQMETIYQGLGYSRKRVSTKVDIDLSGGRNDILKAMAVAGLSKGKPVDLMVTELLNSAPGKSLFNDHKESQMRRHSAHENAERFVKSIAKSVEHVIEQPEHALVFKHVTNKGLPLATIENLEILLRHYKITCRYNVISKTEEVNIPGCEFSLDNKANCQLTQVASLCEQNRVPTKNLASMLSLVCDKIQFNPVADWVVSRPWDKTSRLQDLFDTLKIAEEEVPEKRKLKETLLRKWLLSAIAAAMSPDGISAHGVLVFQGEQYKGKTMWLKKLAPGFVADGVSLNLRDKDSVDQAIQNWIVELGELDSTFKRSDVAQLKAFLTKNKDILRRPFAAKKSEFARRTVFCGSVNAVEFLADNTGNRRFWTLDVVEIDYAHKIDMQQVWAEVYETLFQTGETWFLSHDELLALNDHNQNFERSTTVEDRFSDYFDWDAPRDQWLWTTATQTLIDMGIERPTEGEARIAGTALRKRNGNASRRSHGAKLILRPPSKKKFGGTSKNDVTRPYDWNN